jgi:D-alanyl-D-alanine dipeptidase
MIWHDRVDVYYVADSPTGEVRPEKIGLPAVPAKWEPLEGVEKVDTGPEGFKKIKQMMGDQGLVGAWVASTSGLRDEEAIFNYYDNPDKHEQWAEERVRNAEARFERIMKMEVKPDFICVGGSGTLIFQTLDIFRQLSLPAVKRAIELAAKAGIPTHVHSCGPEKELVKIMAEETNLTVIDPLEIPPIGDCDLAELKRLYGKKITLKGNLHTTEVMLRGTVDDVVKARKKAIDRKLRLNFIYRTINCKAMKKLFSYILISCIISLGCGCVGDRNSFAGYANGSTVPEGFVYVDKVIPDIIVEMRYASQNNFTGRVVDGYEAPKCILTKQAADALKNVQEELTRYSMSLKIYDAYRPQRAVDDFVKWWKDASDIRTKNEYYPDIPRELLFKEGYISIKSTHTRGSTVDLTIVMLPQKQELSMGSNFDLFGEQSNTEFKNIKPFQKVNRLLLKSIMEKHGFVNYKLEWWHYTLKNEPFPDTYFNFPVR